MDPMLPPPIRWHNSLIARMMMLCAVLVACLFSAVYFLTGHYYKQVVTTMQRQAEEIAEAVKVQLDSHPDIALEDAPARLDMPEETVPMELRLVAEVGEPSRLSPQITEEGTMFFMATQTILLENGQPVQLTVRMNVNPQTELVRAFKNRYLIAVTSVFLMTLGAMIYLIAQSLRPLRALSESCAKITEGNLDTLDVRPGPGEIRSLEHTFNRMVASLREKSTVEANLRRAQRLSAIGNLAAGVAHDVRNPLNAIKLLSSQALDDLRERNADGGASKALTTIRSEVDRLEGIVSGFLSLAKEEELQRELQRLDPILSECINLVLKDAESRGVRLSGELRAGDAELSLDAKKLKRAVLNVLLNALEVCPPGGRVRMFSRMQGDSVEIEIRDDGPGMTPETIEHAFDPYFTTKPTGTGLGLSITRGIIEEHGGTIGLTSAIGHGVQVLITLPLRPPRSAAPGNAGSHETIQD